ncbi:hypothetical protein [Chitinophaga filiformis]|uniref:ABM domain-containing protein n=1 Tax=Chitinophaga filiformis TaxID=104663 RepID=A0A1G7MGQ7_CHIFI|nr:hypothetical protein [Chitinophaga filiformis]SDF60897.1 hypothetical protein SAMN04488121_102420 [Chitinophaga filiformis]
MEIIIHTKSGKANPLYESINKKIDDKVLKTWEIRKDSDSNTHYNHVPDQWSDRAMLKPYADPNGLKLVISWWSKKDEPDEATKGYIIGRFTEILMAHFRDQFIHLEIR